MFSKQQWSFLAAELAVVVLGILIAFQVEEWRDGRSMQREVKASLSRLAEETAYNVDWCARSEPRYRRDVSDAEVVFQSLRSVHIDPENLVAFERGLASASGLPPFRLRMSVVDEMISTGMLRQIGNVVLREAISEIHALQIFADGTYPSRREAIRDLSDELFDHVDVDTTMIDPQGATVRAESALESASGTLTERSLEGGTRVDYDFAALAGDRRLVNLFYNALDSRADQVTSVSGLCETARAIDALLTKVSAGGQ